MAYRRTYKKRSYRKRRLTRKRYTRKRYNRNVEYKRKEVTVSNVMIPAATPVFTLLNGIEEGTGPTERIGRKICMKQLQVRATIKNQTNDEVVRVMLVIDKQANSTIFSIDDLLTSSIATQGYINSLKKVDFARRFWVLYDRTYVFDVDSTEEQRKFIKINKRMNIPVNYDDRTDLVASISRNSMYLVTISSDATTELNLAMVSRLRYTDD